MWTTSRRPPEVFKELGGHSSLFAFMPYLPERIYRREIYNKLKKIRDIAERELEEHERTFEPNNMRDFVTVYRADGVDGPIRPVERN